MDCKTARLLLEFARPGSGELEESEGRALQDHLHDCPDCALLAAAERRADEYLGRAVRDVPVPDSLRQRLLIRLGAERHARFRRWIGQLSTAILALLLASWLGYLWWNGPRPAIDVNEILYSGSFSEPRSRPEAVEAWFARRGITMVAPPRFNYDLLHSYEIADFQGKLVPSLLFVHAGKAGKAPAVARVFVLSASQFDLKRSLEFGTFANGNEQSIEIELHRDEEASYLIVSIYSGGDLNSFKTGVKRG